MQIVGTIDSHHRGCTREEVFVGQDILHPPTNCMHHQNSLLCAPLFLKRLKEVFFTNKTNPN